MSNFTFNRDHINKKSKETRMVTYTPADILVGIYSYSKHHIPASSSPPRFLCCIILTPPAQHLCREEDGCGV